MIRLLLLYTASAVLAGSLPAQNSPYDGMRSEDGYRETAGPLAGQALTGPAGWEPTWSLPKTDRSPLYLFREAAGLKYPAIAYPGGGAVRITPADPAPLEIGRKLTQGIAMKGNAAIFASFLMSVSEKKAQGMAYALFNGIGGLGAGISDGFLMVLSRQQVESLDGGPPKQEWIPLLIQEYQPGTTFFFIVKISDGGDEWGGEDEMEVWINPQDVSTKDAASSHVLVYNTDAPGNIAPPSGSITQLLLHSENLQGITLTFDEFRVGTTWESVTGAPQP